MTLDGKVYIMGFSGIYEYKDNVWKMFIPYPEISPRLFYQCMLRVDTFRYLIGGSEGLFLYDTRKKIFEALPQFKNTTVRWLRYDQYLNRIWVCTYGDGFYAIDHAMKVQKLPLDHNNFLATAHCVLRHRSGTYWIPTNLGLFRVPENVFSDILNGRLNQLVYTYYDISDGLPTNEFNGGYQNSAITMADGRLAFASQLGIVTIDPDVLNVQQQHSQIVVDRVYINDSSVTPKSGYHLKADIYIMRFEIAAINRFLANVPIYYRLVAGGDEGIWTETSANGILELAGLRSGDIRVELAVADQSGNFKVLRTISVIIDEPWYSSKIAIVLYGIGLTGLVILGYVLRIKILRRRAAARLLKQTNSTRLAMSELKALQAQINPHYLSNGLQALQYAIINNQTSQALECVRLYSQLMRKVLNMSEKQFITFKEEEAYLHNYLKLETFRLSDTLHYTIDFQTDSKDTYYIPAMLIQPLVENAIIHGLQPKKEGPKELHISATFGTIVVITIRDNGVGRMAGVPGLKDDHQSMGMDNVRMRIKNIASSLQVSISLTVDDLKDENGNPSGTQVTITMWGFDNAVLAAKYKLLMQEEI